MNEASENLEFERAIEYRELIGSVKKVLRNRRLRTPAGRTEMFLPWRQEKRTQWYRCSLSAEEG